MWAHRSPRATSSSVERLPRALTFAMRPERVSGDSGSIERLGLLAITSNYTSCVNEYLGGDVAEVWSRSEVEAIVADYFDMLGSELRGMSFNKAAHRRALVKLLAGRSEEAVEFKHCNISAILNELGVPCIDGYKPRGNYQRLLAEIVADRLSVASSLVRIVAEDVDGRPNVPDVDEILKALTDPPLPASRIAGTHEQQRTPYQGGLPKPAINFLERESRNRELGMEGELFALRFEQARLTVAGQERLAARVEHVSVIRGDGAGFDILSFDVDGRERLIEVKTTKYAGETPFFVSRNELEVSRVEKERYHLYRCFGFRKKPRLFTLQGALPETCVLDPVTYQASVA